MSKSTSPRRRLTRAALASGALLAGLALSGAARAADDGAGSLIDTVTGILMFGDSSQDKKPEIDYRQRAPLVLPPKGATGLPAPESPDRRRAANWPADPDVARRAAAEAEARAPRALEPDHGPRVTMQELNARRGPGGDKVVPIDNGCRNFGGGECVWMNPDKLRSLGVKKDEASRVPVGSEPSRDWLTEPPKGYRRVTQATGGGVAKPQQTDDSPNALGFFTNPFRKDEEE